MQSVSELLYGLPLQGKDDETKSNLFSKFFTFFSVLLTRCKKNPATVLTPQLPEVTIKALSYLVTANIEHGLEYFLTMGYHSDYETRSAFLKVLTNILKERMNQFDKKYAQNLENDDDLISSKKANKYYKLLENVIINDKNFEVINSFSEIIQITEADQFCQLIVRIFQNHTSSTTGGNSTDRIIELIKFITEKEVAATDSENTLFRRNSMATKLLAAYSKLIGKDYLKAAVAPEIKELIKNTPNFEIDPALLSPDEDLEQNQSNVIKICESFLKYFSNTIEKCPRPIKEICHFLKGSIRNKFPGAEYTAIGGFMFLRFICPAIISPDQFSIVDQTITDRKLRRCLVIVTKVLQNLANRVQFSKEPFMYFLNPFIDDNLDVIRSLFDQYADLQADAPSSSDVHESLSTNNMAFGLSPDENEQQKQQEEDILNLHILFYRNIDKLNIYWQQQKQIQQDKQKQEKENKKKETEAAVQTKEAPPATPTASAVEVMDVDLLFEEIEALNSLNSTLPSIKGPIVPPSNPDTPQPPTSEEEVPVIEEEKEVIEEESAIRNREIEVIHEEFSEIMYQLGVPLNIHGQNKLENEKIPSSVIKNRKTNIHYESFMKKMNLQPIDHINTSTFPIYFHHGKSKLSNSNNNSNSSNSQTNINQTPSLSSHSSLANIPQNVEAKDAAAGAATSGNVMIGAGIPILYFIFRNFNPSSFTADLFNYYLLKITEPFLHLPFAIVIDLTFFTIENQIPLPWINTLLTLLPPEISENLKNIIFINPNHAFKKYSKRVGKLLPRYIIKKFLVLHSILKLFDFIEEAQCPISKDIISIETTIQSTFSPVTKINQKNKEEVKVIICTDYIGIIYLKPILILSQHCNLMEIIHISSIIDIQSITKDSKDKDSDQNQIFIKYNPLKVNKSDNSDQSSTTHSAATRTATGGANTDEKVIHLISSSSSDQLLQQLMASKDRYNLSQPKNALARVKAFRPSDVPGTLLNMAFLNLTISNNHELRLSAYNLLVTLSNTFSFKIDSKLLEGSDIAIPRNTKNVIMKFSRELAVSEPSLTLEFIQQALDCFVKADSISRVILLDYVKPWLINLQYIQLTDEKQAKLKEIFNSFIKLTLEFIDVISPVFLSKVWKSLGKLSGDILEIIIVTLIDLILSSPPSSSSSPLGTTLMDCLEDIFITLSTQNPSFISGKLLHLLLNELQATYSPPSIPSLSSCTPSLVPASHVERIELTPNWNKCELLIRWLLTLSFENLICVERYLPELFHIILMCFYSGDSLIRSNIQALFINIIHSLVNSNSNFILNDKVQALNNYFAEFQQIQNRLHFGVGGNKSNFSPYKRSQERGDEKLEVMSIIMVENVATSILNIIQCCSPSFLPPLPSSPCLPSSSNTSSIHTSSPIPSPHSLPSLFMNINITSDGNILNSPTNNAATTSVSLVSSANDCSISPIHTRLLSLTTVTAFSPNPFLQPRAFCSLGIFTQHHSLINDDLISNTIRVLRKNVADYDSVFIFFFIYSSFPPFILPFSPVLSLISFPLLLILPSPHISLLTFAPPHPILRSPLPLPPLFG